MIHDQNISCMIRFINSYIDRSPETLLVINENFINCSFHDLGDHNGGWRASPTLRRCIPGHFFLDFYLIFIGPESDHWECLSLTHSLTDALTPV